METKNKLLILSLSFAIFIVGVRALYSEPGVVRNGVLAASVMGLVAIRAASVPTAGRSQPSRIPTCIWSFRSTSRARSRAK